MQTSLRKSLVVSTLALGATFIVPHAIAAPDNALHWHSVIGIVQANNVVGSGTGAVIGGGTPWSASGGKVDSTEPDNIAFLIRAGAGRWIANGTVLR